MVCSICFDSLLNVQTEDCAGSSAAQKAEAVAKYRPVALNCGHVFHKECILDWFKVSRRFDCPKCQKRHSGPPLALYLEIEMCDLPAQPSSATTAAYNNAQSKNNILLNSVATRLDKVSVDGWPSLRVGQGKTLYLQILDRIEEIQANFAHQTKQVQNTAQKCGFLTNRSSKLLSDLKAQRVKNKSLEKKHNELKLQINELLDEKAALSTRCLDCSNNCRLHHDELERTQRSLTMTVQEVYELKGALANEHNSTYEAIQAIQRMAYKLDLFMLHRSTLQNNLVKQRQILRKHKSTKRIAQYLFNV